MIGFLKTPDGNKNSMGRLLCLIVVLAGVGTIAGGMVLAFLEFCSPGAKGTQGKEIVLAGIGALFSGVGAKAWQAQAEAKNPGKREKAK